MFVTDRSQLDHDHCVVGADSTKGGCRSLAVQDAERNAKSVASHQAISKEYASIWGAKEPNAPDRRRSDRDRIVWAKGAGEVSGFPQELTTDEAKIAWLAAKAEEAKQAIVAEEVKPLRQQNVGLYREIDKYAGTLIQLMSGIAGNFPRLAWDLEELKSLANRALERILNDKLEIGMTTDQVREIRGEPSRKRTKDFGEVEWHYAKTVLSFKGGKLSQKAQSR